MDAISRKTHKKLVNMAKRIVDNIHAEIDPEVAIPIRSLSNVTFDEKKSIIELGDDKTARQLFNLGQARKFMQTFLIAAACKDLLKEGKTTSIRDLYYITKHTMGESRQNTFEDQNESDPIIEDLEVTVDALREELHLAAAKRGSMVGPLTVVDAGDTINLRRMGSGGWSIPSIVEEKIIQFKKCEAEYILLVEKEAIWGRLNEDKFWKQHKCLLLSGNGMAPRGVRRLIYRLHHELKLPVYVLVDNDPWGFYIYSVIKQGSINLAYESQRMAVPKARFLGLSSFDREKYNLPDNVTIKLDDQDERRAKQMLAYPWFQRRAWQKEIRAMTRAGVKLELEALSAKGISYISEEYLPQKIRDGAYLA